MTIKTPVFTLPQVDVNDDEALFGGLYDATHHFFKHCILWGLEQFEVGRQEGKHDAEFCAQPVVQNVAFGMLKVENEAVFEIMAEIDENTNKYYGDAIFGAALRELLEMGAISYDAETRGVATNVPVN
jgi:hypothetical protein